MSERIDKHKEKLIRDITEEITVLFEKSLDYAEVAIPNVDQYKRYRAKILRFGNNCIRNITRVVNNHYSVKFEASSETIIETKLSSKVGSAAAARQRRRSGRGCHLRAVEQPDLRRSVLVRRARAGRRLDFPGQRSAAPAGRLRAHARTAERR